MKRIAVAAIALFLATGAAAVPPPAFEWNGIGSPTDREWKQLLADGSAADRPLPAGEKTLSGKPAIRLDGNSLIAVPARHDGAQTIRVLVRYPDTVRGALISRHRTEEGMRGIEAGFASANFFTFDGGKPAAQVSDGRRDAIRSIFDAKAPGPVPGKWYECILRFAPGDQLTFRAVDRESGKLLFERSVACPEITALSPQAGSRLLCIGGRRANSKSCGEFAPAGTQIGGVTVWNAALEDGEIAAALGLPSETALSAPVTRYVNGASGDDANDGLSKDKPLRTIQRAADQVNPGDTVMIAPGLYFETVRFTRGGTAEQPVAFRADGEPGSVTVTAADREIREKKKSWNLEDAALGLYSIPFDHIPSRVLYSGVDLFPCSSLEGLKTFLLKDGYPAPENGFYFDEPSGKLYVRLHPSKKYGSIDPNEHTMSVSPPPAGGSNGHHVSRMQDSNFFVEPKEPMHLVFSGFLFETPGTAGIVTAGSDLVVRDSLFKGCRAAVWGFGDARNIFVENCRYDQAHTYFDALDTVAKWSKTDVPKKHRFYFWARKGVNCNSDKMKNYETGIVGGVGENWHVRNNLIVDCFEGMSSWCVSNSKGMQVYGNVFRGVVDNAVESENHAADMRIYNNRFEDVLEPISWQPLDGTPWPGPVYTYRNLFVSTAGIQPLADALQSYGVFKIGAEGRNWMKPHMGGVKVEQLAAKVSKRFVVVPDPGFLAFNNTIVRRTGFLFTTPQPVVGPAARELVNFRYFNNIFDVGNMHKLPEWKGSLIEFYRNYATGYRPGDAQAAIMAGENGIENPDPASVGFVDAAQGDFRLRADSPARGKGFLVFEEPDASLDLGAIPFGTAWNPVAGPGTAVDPAMLSPFARQVLYLPELVRSAGPEPGRWGVYSVGEPVRVALGKPASAPKRIRLIFRTTEPESSAVLLRGGKFTVTLRTSNGKAALTVADGNAAKEVALDPLSRDLWRTVELDLKAEGLTPPAAGVPWSAEVGRNPVYEIELF